MKFCLSPLSSTFISGKGDRSPLPFPSHTHNYVTGLGSGGGLSVAGPGSESKPTVTLSVGGPAMSRRLGRRRPTRQTHESFEFFNGLRLETAAVADDGEVDVYGVVCHFPDLGSFK